MGETGFHIDEFIHALTMLRDWYAAEPNVYVGGNLLLYYEDGNPRKRVAPDVFVSLEVPKKPKRDHYLVWKEGKAPDFILEITSKLTKREDEKMKLPLYRDVLRVPEYFLFDPRADYLDPPFQGFRLAAGEYVPIAAINGRLPSVVLGLHLAREDQSLRLYDPATGQRLLTRLEARQAADQRADEQAQRAEQERQRAKPELQRADEQRQRAAAAEADQHSLAEENKRLRQEIEAMRKNPE